MKEKLNVIKEEVIEELVRNCYDEDGLLSIENISNVYKKEPEEMICIFDEYVNSLTGDEIMIAYHFGFSKQALKLTNVKILQNRVKGYSRSISDLSQNKEKEINFLKSINNICEEYYEKKRIDEKRYLI